jgi:hypothetical protein
MSVSTVSPVTTAPVSRTVRILPATEGGPPPPRTRRPLLGSMSPAKACLASALRSTTGVIEPVTGSTMATPPAPAGNP